MASDALLDRSMSMDKSFKGHLRSCHSAALTAACLMPLQFSPRFSCSECILPSPHPLCLVQSASLACGIVRCACLRVLLQKALMSDIMGTFNFIKHTLRSVQRDSDCCFRYTAGGLIINGQRCACWRLKGSQIHARTHSFHAHTQGS